MEKASVLDLQCHAICKLMFTINIANVIYLAICFEFVLRDVLWTGIILLSCYLSWDVSVYAYLFRNLTMTFIGLPCIEQAKDIS